MSEEQKALSFEEAMQKLETALNALNQGDIPLEDALKQYKEGLDMAALCQRMLEKAEGEIKILQDGALKNFALEDEAHE